MRTGFGPALFVMAAAAGSALVAQTPIIRDPHLYRSGIELTSINATVRDADGRLVPGLSREDFEIF